jgi:Skp family chaperone for outer membrane proteins
MNPEEMTEEEIDKKIAELETQRAEIRRKEREKAEAKKKQEREERKADLQKIEAALDDFNKKYNYTLCLGVKRNSDISKDLFYTLFPLLGD